MNRVPPQAVNVERHVVGAAFCDSDAVSVILEALEPEDFYFDAHRFVFQAIQALSAKSVPCDLFTVSDAMRSAGTFVRAGGEELLLGISAEVVSAANVEEHCGIVKDRSLKRRQIAVLTSATEQAYSDDPGATTQEFLEREVFKLGSAKSEKKTLRSMNDVLVDSLAALEKRKSGSIVGLPTGIACLDQHLGGLAGFIVLGARPAQGKTALAAQISVHNAKAGKVVAFFEGEMKDRAVVDRALFSEAGVNQETLRRGRLLDRDYPRLSLAVGALSGIPFFIDDSAGITPGQIRAKCRRLRQTVGLDLIVIDNIQRMRSDSRTSDLRVRATEVSMSLKEIEKEFGVPVIGISHIRRLQGGDEQEPTLSDLQESGNIEQDADVVILLHRPDLYKQAEPGMEGKTKAIFAKFREGSLGYTDLFFEKTLVTFYDWDTRPTKGYDDWTK